MLTIPRATAAETYLSLSNLRLTLRSIMGQRERMDDGFIHAALFQSPQFYPRMQFDGSWLWGESVIRSQWHG